MISKIKSFLLPALLLSAGIACRNSAQKQDSKDVAEDKNTIKFRNKEQEKNAAFTVDAVAGFNDIRYLAELARRKSGSTVVREMAAALQNNYTPLTERFRSYGVKNNISLPAGETKEARDEAAALAALPAAQLNRKWCELLMEKHKKMIGNYEAAVSGLLRDTGDSLTMLTTAALPAVRTQYDKLMQYHHTL